MMIRYAIVALVALLTYSSGAPQGSMVRWMALRSARAGAASPVPNVVNAITVTNKSGVAISNYPFQFGRPFLDGAIPRAPRVLIGGTPAASQADVKNRYPDRSVEFAVMAVVIPSIPPNGRVTLTFQDTTASSNTALTSAQMLDPSYNFDAALTLTPNSGAAGSFSGDATNARTMLQNGNYKLWTSGPVAQTIILADDTAARKYDIGFGDGFHPLRPRYYATFWPATNQVSIRAVVESANPQEVEDTDYKVTITAGQTSPATVYTADLSGDGTTRPPKIHWAQTSWTQRFWLGGTPNPEINIDNNLAYLESTRFVPNYDAAVTIDPVKGTAAEYALWTGRLHGIYDGTWDGGLWQTGMGSPGARPDIGPAPTWTAMWLHNGDWRLRTMALGMADLAAAWPQHLRESDPTRRLLRTDAVGSGTGLGLPVSIVGRPTLDTWATQDSTPADAIKIVGPHNISSANGNPWGYESSHEPAPFYPQYVLTGDPWYLGEAEMWASNDAARYPSGTCTYCRGLDGTYGGITDELRGGGWVIRSRAEAAFAVPDGDPEKTYLGTLVNDALARWEGGFGITGTVYTGSAMQVWGASVGNYYSLNSGPVSTKAPPLHNWASAGNPTAGNIDPTILAAAAHGLLVANAVGSFTDPWMEWYVGYALGRATELGFAAGPLTRVHGQFELSLINNSGVPTGIAIYEMPIERYGGGFFPTWASLFASMEPAFLTGNGWTGNARGIMDLPVYFASKLTSQGYDAYAMAALAALVNQKEAGAAPAWQWMNTNVNQAIAGANPGYGYNWSEDPCWDIVPRTDTNALPPQPTKISSP
jgi:hypothetical protein